MSVDTMVLGLGNVLLGDDGIGVWVVDSLCREFRFPKRVDVVEGGTLGLTLLAGLHGVRRLLVVDAVQLGGAPGEIVRLEDEQLARALELKLSSHEVGLIDLLGAARLTGSEPAHVVLWGMEPESLNPGIAFSAVVARALPALRAQVLGELSRWNVAGRRQTRGGLLRRNRHVQTDQTPQAVPERELPAMAWRRRCLW